jgi:dCTP deaminase
MINIEPFFERSKMHGMTFGLGPCGYDVRLGGALYLESGKFMLGYSIEHMEIPRDIVGYVFDKSTLARLGLSLFNTVLEPGWRGHITLEISNRGQERVVLPAGSPIAQVQFFRTDTWCDPYDGRYQDQGPQAVGAIFE